MKPAYLPIDEAPPIIELAAAELEVDTSGSGSGYGNVLSVPFDHIAGRKYRITWAMTMRRSATGDLASVVESSLVALPARRKSQTYASNPGSPRQTGAYVRFVANVSGTSIITLQASALAGGAFWYCFPVTEYTTIGAYARIVIDEVG